MHQDVARSFNITESWPSSCENFSFVANALFLNNLMPFGGCMGYSWTMALNFQFYFFFPLLIIALWRRVSPRVICVTVVLLSFIARLVAFQSLRVHTIGTPEGFFFTFFWYTNSFTRVGTLFFGALLADLCASKSFVEGVRARRWLQGLCWAIVAATLVCQRMWNQWFRAPLPSITAPGANAVVFAQQGSWVGAQLFFYSSILVGGPLSAFIFAWLTFCILNRVGAIGRALNALCSFSLFAPLSQLTFFAYLLHPMIMVKLFSTLLYPPRWTPLDVARHILVMMVSTFSLALVLHLLLERPLEFLLRRGEGKWPRLQRMVTAYSTLCMVLSVLAHVASAYIILTAQPKA
jgi:peptidoglycan/LPS O-acetylase OafA/YrhL